MGNCRPVSCKIESWGSSSPRAEIASLAVSSSGLGIPHRFNPGGPNNTTRRPVSVKVQDCRRYLTRALPAATVGRANFRRGRPDCKLSVQFHDSVTCHSLNDGPHRGSQLPYQEERPTAVSSIGGSTSSPRLVVKTELVDLVVNFSVTVVEDECQAKNLSRTRTGTRHTSVS